MKEPRTKLARNMFTIGEYQLEKDEGTKDWSVFHRCATPPAPSIDFSTYADARDYAKAMSTLGRLIAAAPALLAALRYLVREATANGMLDVEPAIVQASAAIAKAKG